MNDYIITFHSHYGAMTFFNAMKAKNAEARLMPVPRALSASCGVCVSVKGQEAVSLDGYEVDAVYMEVEGAYKAIETYK